MTLKLIFRLIPDRSNAKYFPKRPDCRPSERASNNTLCANQDQTIIKYHNEPEIKVLASIYVFGQYLLVLCL